MNGCVKNYSAFFPLYFYIWSPFEYLPMSVLYIPICILKNWFINIWPFCDEYWT